MRRSGTRCARTLGSHKDVLRLDLSEISDAPRIASYRDGALIFVYAPRVVDGIPVRDNSLGAAVNSGNLVLLGVQKWGDVDVSRAPAIEASAAEAAVRSHAAPLSVQELLKAPHLELVPLSGPAGIRYRLAWVVTCRIEDDPGTWEGLVDAANGELIAFEDKNQYAARKVDRRRVPRQQRPAPARTASSSPAGRCPSRTCHAPTASDSTPTPAATSAACRGTISTALDGRYRGCIDICGAINETVAGGDLDLGFGPTPARHRLRGSPGHSAGDTKSAPLRLSTS